MKKRINILATVLLLLTGPMIYAGSATWDQNPSSGDWNVAGNWDPATVPNGPTDVASFATSSVTDIFLSATTEVSQIVFATGASAYHLAVTGPLALTISGPGLTNKSSQTQSFDLYGFHGRAEGVMTFAGSASAESGNVITVHGGSFFNSEGGHLYFNDTSSAGSSTLIGAERIHSLGKAATITFADQSSAGTATITGTDFCLIEFHDQATADHATFNLTANADLAFFDQSNAGSATIVVNGGLVEFGANNAGAMASVTCTDGEVGVSGQNDVPVTVHGHGLIEVEFAIEKPWVAGLGSISGDGEIDIFGPGTFFVGSNNLDTEFSGLIDDDVDAQQGGALNKVGTGALTLSGANYYSGGTIVSRGLLIAANTTGSATGKGQVKVNGGMLAGNGIISGAVTVGKGNGSGASIAPSAAASQPRTLTLGSTVTFKADGTYTYKLNAKKAKADQIVANGVTIETGAQFQPIAVANRPLTGGTVFTAISNTSAALIAGTFTDLPDGGTITIGNNTRLRADYEGGDGNDLTLTVVK